MTEMPPHERLVRLDLTEREALLVAFGLDALLNATTLTRLLLNTHDGGRRRLGGEYVGVVVTQHLDDHWRLIRRLRMRVNRERRDAKKARQRAGETVARLGQ